ncbi:MAG: stage 0 sporulation family protein [Anaerofustis sp.]
MQKIVGIRFKHAGKIYYFDPQQIYLKVGDNVIVETARGLEYGNVAMKVKYVEENELKHPIKPVVRKATFKDDKLHEKNLAKAEEAIGICKEQIIKHKLEMKLIRAEYTFDATKIIFYFTADGRVDFRELVKDLASIFRIRIELRQIGVRDEAKMMGGIGGCGRCLCCNKWLGEFQPVSIKMAKEQNLSLNPGKISGICGRLLCCLQYEHEFYEEALKELPDLGQTVKTPDGEGVVLKLNVLLDTVNVKLNSDDHIIREYSKNDLQIIGKRKTMKSDQVDQELFEDELRELKELTKEKFDNSGDL